MFSQSRLPNRPWANIYVGLIAFAILQLSGCGYTKSMMGGDKKPRFDASTGTNKAIIGETGRQPFDPACRVVQDADLYREVVVDAGEVVLRVDCSRVSGIFGESTEQLGRADLAFRAEPGQHYRIEVSDEFGFSHVTVVATEDGSAVIHRSLLSSRFTTNADPSRVTLVSRSGPGVIPCKFGLRWADRRASSVRRRARSFVHVPYSHQLIAECTTHSWVTGYVKERYEAPVEFLPEPGRLYTVHMDEEHPNFVFVTDVSSGVRTIAHVKAIRTH